MILTTLGVIENDMRTVSTFVLRTFILSTFYLLTACVSMIEEYCNKTNHQGIIAQCLPYNRHSNVLSSKHSTGCSYMPDTVVRP